MSNKAAGNVSSDVEQPATNLLPDMPNDPMAKTNLVAVGTSSEPVQAKTQLFLDELTKGVSRTVVVMVNALFIYLGLFQIVTEISTSDGEGALDQVTVNVDHSQPKDGTLKNLLIWARNRKNDVRLFLFAVTPGHYVLMNYPSCGGSKCKKGIDRKARSFWCDLCNKPVEYPVLRLELDISDQTASTVVVMFDDIATELVKCFADSIMQTEDEVDCRCPYYEHDTFESFTCWRIVPEEAVEESVGSSNIDEKVPAKRKRMKSLAMHPSVSTPSKPAEDKKKKWLNATAHFIVELEDSEEEMASAWNGAQKIQRHGSRGKRRKKEGKDRNQRQRGSLVTLDLALQRDKQTSKSLLSNILYNAFSIHTNTVIRDGKVHSYSGLKLTNIATQASGTRHLPHNTNAHQKQKVIASTSNHPLNNSEIRKSEQDRVRASRKIPKRATLTSAGVYVSYHNLGPPSYECRNCNAYMWYKERNNKGNRAVNPTFSLCCQEGKLLLPKLKETPSPLAQLLDYTAPETSKLREQIRVCNGMFCFTSFGSRIDHSINTGRGVYTFRINGQNYHRIRSLLSALRFQPRYAQVYFFDTHNVVKIRMSTFLGNKMGEGVDAPIVTVNFELHLLSERKTFAHQYNTLTVSEVAALITNDFGDGIATRDIMVDSKDGGPKWISELHPSYMDMQYPLLFPYGEEGFHETIPYHNNAGARKTKCGFILMKEYYAYIIQKRSNQASTLLRGGRLYQQFLMYAYTTVEEQRLKWTRNNQDTLRVDLYHNLNDVVTRGDTHPKGLEIPCPTDEACTVEGKCSKRFPKPFYAKTIIDDDGYPVYRQRDSKVFAVKAPCEAVWRLFSFDIHYSYPSVMKLNFHLEDQNAITLRDSQNLPALLEREDIKLTMFTEWFELNKRDTDSRKLIYAEIPKYYMWLEQAKGPQSFKELMMVNDRLYTTFKEACFAYGLLNDDKEWSHAILEASFWALGPQLQDILHKKRKLFKYPELQLTDEQLKNYCLLEIEAFMRVNEYSTTGEIDTRKQQFNKWVLDMGDGNLPAKKKMRKMRKRGLKFQRNSLLAH
ncbi:ATP-dependent DNA helicase PIF1-like protein [Tanacetum coccineum]